MKKDLILLHGALGSSQQLVAIKSALSHSYNVHSFDFFGHGYAPMKEEFGIKKFADQLMKYIDRQDIYQPVIFGYSMGGYVALYLEAKSPGIIGKIFTLATKFDWNPISAKREAAHLNIEKMKEKVPAYVDFLKDLHGDQWIHTIEATREMMIRMGEKAELDKDKLANITIPCLITVGDQDKMISIDETRSLADALPNGHLEIWSGTPHPIEKFNTETLVAALREFDN